jgi:type IV pilus assembly protein PilQ
LLATDLVLKEPTRGTTEITVNFSGPPVFNARLEQAGRRLVVDVQNSDTQTIPAAKLDRVGVVGSVLTQVFDTPLGKTTRFIVSLTKDAKYSVAANGNQLKIRLVEGQSGALAREDLPMEARSAAPQSVPQIRDVRYEHDRFQDRIVIDLTDTARYKETTDRRTGHARLVFEGTELQSHLERTLDTGAFDGIISSISSFREGRDKRTVVIEVEREKNVRTSITRRGRALVWSFFVPGTLPTTVSGIAADGGIARKAKTLHVEPPLPGLSEVTPGYQPIEQTSSGEQAAAVSPALFAQNRPEDSIWI